MMTGFTTRTLAAPPATYAPAALTTTAFAQSPALDALGTVVRHGLCLRQARQDPLLQDGHQQCCLLLKGAKKVPKGTLFFVGHNGQLYMRSDRI